MSLISRFRTVNSVFRQKFDVFVMGLIIISVLSMSVETIPGLSANTLFVLFVIEVVVTIIFTAEYIFRIYAAKKKLSYIFSFYGIIDFLAIAPFYLTLGVNLQAVRAFRLFRLFQLLKLQRYNSAVARFGKAVKLAKEEVILFLIATLILVYLSAVGIYYFENEVQPEAFASIFHSLWWAMVTLSTVGYGDVYPITVGGKVFTAFVIVFGLGIVAVPAGLVASALQEVRRDERRDD